MCAKYLQVSILPYITKVWQTLNRSQRLEDAPHRCMARTYDTHTQRKNIRTWDKGKRREPNAHTHTHTERFGSISKPWFCKTFFQWTQTPYLNWSGAEIMDSSPFQSINFRSKPLNFLLFLYIFAILFCAIGPCLGKLFCVCLVNTVYKQILAPQFDCNRRFWPKPHTCNLFHVQQKWLDEGTCWKWRQKVVIFHAHTRRTLTCLCDATDD